MAKKKKSVEMERFLILPDGTEFLITGEDGVYWYSGDTQFFKHCGFEIVEREIEPAPAEDK